MDKAQEIDPAVIQAQVDAEIEVTIRHPNFGEYAFRAVPDEIGARAHEMLKQAQDNADTRKAVAELDEIQNKKLAEAAACEKRIEAATVLGDSSRIAQEQQAKMAIEAGLAAIEQQRAALNAQLK